MNGGTIEIDVRITDEDYRRTWFWFNKTSLTTWAVVGVVSVVLFFFGAIFVTSSRPEVPLLIFVPILSPFFISIYIRWHLFRKIRRQAAIMASTNERKRFSFSRNGMNVESDSTSVQTSWSGFFRIQEIEADFLFFTLRNVFFPIPKGFFRNAAEINKMRKLITENVSEAKRVLIR